MQATETRPAEARPLTPAWLWAALLLGAMLMVAWAFFILGFVSEPSAVGGVLAVLVGWIALSTAAAASGAAAALALLRRRPLGRPLAWIAASLMTITGVGAIAGIPALVGLWSSRKGREGKG